MTYADKYFAYVIFIYDLCCYYCFSFGRRRTWDTEQLNNLPKVLYLESPEAKMQTLAFADLHP